jgi:hypothetical protein
VRRAVSEGADFRDTEARRVVEEFIDGRKAGEETVEVRANSAQTLPNARRAASLGGNAYNGCQNL